MAGNIDEAKRQEILTLLLDPIYANQSAKAVARYVGVHPTTVSRYRDRLGHGQEHRREKVERFTSVNQR